MNLNDSRNTTTQIRKNGLKKIEDNKTGKSVSKSFNPAGFSHSDSLHLLLEASGQVERKEDYERDDGKCEIYRQNKSREIRH